MADRTQAEREMDWNTGRELERKDAEIAKLRQQIAELAPFLAVWADQYQRDHGLDGLHPVHYEMLAASGARMVDFKRATNAAH